MTFSFFPRLLLSRPTLSHSLRPLATAFCCLFSFLASFFQRVLPLCILCMSCVSVFLVMSSIIWRRWTLAGVLVGGFRRCDCCRLKEPFSTWIGMSLCVSTASIFYNLAVFFLYNERMSAAPICESVVSGCRADQAFCICPQ